MNKEYFMSRLANGEDMNAIGAEIAAMMNEAMAEHAAKIEAEKAMAAQAAAEAEKEEAKRDLIEEMVEIIQELAILEGMDPDELSITDEDMDALVNAFTEMFAAMREMKKMVAAMEAQFANAPKTSRIQNAPMSDDQILAEFAKMFS